MTRIARPACLALALMAPLSLAFAQAPDAPVADEGVSLQLIEVRVEGNRRVEVEAARAGAVRHPDRIDVSLVEEQEQERET